MAGAHNNKAYREDIDGLRAIAVLAVLGYHAFPTLFPGGFVGVDVFFVISGFLITGILLKSARNGPGQGNGKLSILDFYSRRIRRIFPALITVLIATMAFGHFWFFYDEFRQLGKHVAHAGAFVSNFALWGEAGYFESATELKPLLHLWSLGIEEQFYLIWPLLVGLAFRIPRELTLLMFALFAGSFAMGLSNVHTPAGFYLPWCRFWELLAGAWLAHLSYAGQHLPTRFRSISSFAGLVLIVASVFVLSKESPFPGWLALFPVIGTALLIAAGEGSSIARRLLKNRALVAIGLISYPLYLWHWPLLSFAANLNSGTPAPVIRGGLLLLSFALAALTYHFIEKPIRFGKRIPSSLWLVIPMVFVTVWGFWVWKSRVDTRHRSQEHDFSQDLRLPDETRASDGSCEKWFGLKVTAPLVCLARESNPTILIAGDSHAMAFHSAAQLGLIPLKSVLVAGHTCLPFLDDMSYDSTVGPNSTKHCLELFPLIMDTLKANPTIRKIVLSTRGPAYFTGQTFGYEPTGYWKNLKFPSGDSRKAFREGYSLLISELEKLKLEIIFIIDVPELGIDPHSCIPRLQASRSCSNPRSAVDMRQSEYREIVRDLAARHPKLKIFDPIDVLCSAEECAGTKDGRILYFNYDHLSVPGSHLILKDFIKKFGH